VSDASVYKFQLENGVSRLETVEESKVGNSYSLVLDEIFAIVARQLMEKGIESREIYTKY